MASEGVFRRRVSLVGLTAFVVAAAAALACGPAAPGQKTLTIYSSRSQSLVHPILDEYARASGTDVQVRYDTTASILATVMEEGQNSPADVLYLGESTGLAAMSERGMLAELPRALSDKVDARFRSSKGEWVGTSGRAKVVVYNTRTIDPSRDLPASIMDFTRPEWKGRIGWSPTHGEWQLTVTAIRVLLGEAAARQWVEGIKANQPRVYPNLISTVQAAADGEIDVGFVNHYYVPRLIAERGEGFGARNHFLRNGDAGALVDVAAAGILKTTKHSEAARDFVDFLLGPAAQQYFAQQTYEYPLSAGVQPLGALPPMAEINPPHVDPDKLADLQGTLKLLREAQVIP
jgi:iron(III) transport system substrate-binding protein